MEKKKNNFHTLQQNELHEKLDNFRKELFKLRLRSTTSSVANFSSMQRTLKKDIARILTVLKQKSFAV